MKCLVLFITFIVSSVLSAQDLIIAPQNTAEVYKMGDIVNGTLKLNSTKLTEIRFLKDELNKKQKKIYITSLNSFESDAEGTIAKLSFIPKVSIKPEDAINVEIAGDYFMLVFKELKVVDGPKVEEKFKYEGENWSLQIFLERLQKNLFWVFLVLFSLGIFLFKKIRSYLKASKEKRLLAERRKSFFNNISSLNENKLDYLWKNRDELVNLFNHKQTEISNFWRKIGDRAFSPVQTNKDLELIQNEIKLLLDTLRVDDGI